MNENNKRNNFLYFTSLRYGIYSLISFLVALGIIVPVTRFAGFILITGYTLYVSFDIFRSYAKTQEEGKYGMKAFIKAFSIDGIELIYLFLALLIGFIVGLGL